MSDATKLMTREEVATRLGVTVAEIRRRQRVGPFPPPVKQKGPRGEVLWDSAVIEPLASHREKQKNASSYTAEEASKVFAAFEQGMSDVEVVVKLQVPPASVRALRIDYADLKQGLFISEEALKEINDLPIDGELPIHNEADLLNFMRSLAAAKCGECHKKPRLFCKSCVTDALKTTRERVTAELQGTAEL